MSGPVAWSSLTLASLSDLTYEIGEGSILFSAYDPGRIQNAYGAVKQQVWIDLKADLTDLYASRNGKYQRFDVIIREMGYSYNELDTMLDKIGNPADTLVEPVKAKWAWQLWIWLSSDNRPNYKALMPYCMEQASIKDSAYKARMKEAKKNMWLDLNSDGQTVDYERVRTHNSFVRT
jgi:hypothetical protein